MTHPHRPGPHRPCIATVPPLRLHGPTAAAGQPFPGRPKPAISGHASGQYARLGPQALGAVPLALCPLPFALCSPTGQNRPDAAKTGHAGGRGASRRSPAFFGSSPVPPARPQCPAYREPHFRAGRGTGQHPERSTQPRPEPAKTGKNRQLPRPRAAKTGQSRPPSPTLRTPGAWRFALCTLPEYRPEAAKTGRQPSAACPGRLALCLCTLRRRRPKAAQGRPKQATSPALRVPGAWRFALCPLRPTRPCAAACSRPTTISGTPGSPSLPLTLSPTPPVRRTPGLESKQWVS